VSVIGLNIITRLSIHQELASLVNNVHILPAMLLIAFAVHHTHSISLISAIISALKLIMIRMAQDTQYLFPAIMGIDGVNSTILINASMSPSITPHQLLFTLPAALLLSLTCVTSAILPLATSSSH
jgi:hypothetical protein